MQRRLEECYDLIENMTAHHNDWDTSAHKGESTNYTTSSSFEIATLAHQMVKMQKDMLQMFRHNQQVNSMTPSCETYGSPHSYYECQAAGGYTQDTAYSSTDEILRNSMISIEANFNSLATSVSRTKKSLQERPQGALPNNTEPNPRADIKAITIQTGVVLDGPSVPPPHPSSKELEREPKTIPDQ
nr:reverse transcriptase domain-containing protein [Tanacetum cinerariifolium]